MSGGHLSASNSRRERGRIPSAPRPRSDDLLSNSSSRPRVDLTRLLPSQRAEEIDEVVQEIYKKMRRQDANHLSFLCDYDLREILLSYRWPLFKFEHWTRLQRETVTERCPQVLATLLLSGAFTHLQSIRDLFFNRMKEELLPLAITDADLWIMDEHRLQFLPSTIRRDFLEKQYVLKPYRLEEKRPNRPLQVPLNARLPFIKEDRISTGGYGVVSKVVVAYRYLWKADGSEYKQDEACALKQIQASRDFLKETRHLQILKENITDHKHVARHYVSFIQGDTFNILLPLAKHGDLEQFLNEGITPGSDENNPKLLYNFDMKFRHFDRNDPQCILDLLQQISCVAAAVKWLHSGEVGGVCLIHMDLKPANILIMEDASISGEQSTVGFWQITDFGISAPTAKQNSRLTIFDVVQRVGAENLDGSKTHARRPVGTYQPPEVELEGDDAMGPKSDVWSLACIFADVIAFALGGRIEFIKFQNRRGVGRRDDFFYSKIIEERGRVPHNPPRFRVRTAVTDWLEELTSIHHDHGDWVRCCIQIVRDTLVCGIEQRPSAAQFHEDLEDAKKHYTSPEEYGRGKYTTLRHARSTIPRQRSTSRSRQRSLTASIDRPTASSSQPLTTVPLDRDPTGTSHNQPQLQLQPSSSFPSHHPSPASDHRSTSTSQHLQPTSSRLSIPPFPIPPEMPSSSSAFKERQSSSATSRTQPETAIALRQQGPLKEGDVVNRSIRARPSEARGAKNCKIVDLSICPVRKRAAWLFQSALSVTHVMSTDDDPRRLYLPTGPEWVKVEVLGQLVAVRGQEGSGNTFRKHVIFYDLNDPYPYPQPLPNQKGMSRVDEMAISPAGFLALKGDKEVLLFDLRDLKNSHTPLSTDGKHNFAKPSFTSTGHTLVAWAYGKDKSDRALETAIYTWRLHPDTRRVVSGSCRYYVIPEHPPSTILALYLGPVLDDDQPLDCLIQERNAFFTVRLEGRSGSSLNRISIQIPNATEAIHTVFYKDIAHGVLYKDVYLLTFARIKKGGFFKKRDKISLYSLDFENAKAEHAFTNEYDVLSDKCRVQLFTLNESMFAVVLGLDEKARDIKLRRSQITSN